MDEDDAEPVVDVEVGVEPVPDEGGPSHAARVDQVALVDGRRHRHRDVVAVEEATDLRRGRRHVDDARGDDHVRDGAPAVGEGRVADAHVALRAETTSVVTVTVAQWGWGEYHRRLW